MRGRRHAADARVRRKVAPHAAVEAAGPRADVVEGPHPRQTEPNGLPGGFGDGDGLHAGLGPLCLLRPGPGPRALSNPSLHPNSLSVRQGLALHQIMSDLGSFWLTLLYATNRTFWLTLSHAIDRSSRVTYHMRPTPAVKRIFSESRDKIFTLVLHLGTQISQQLQTACPTLQQILRLQISPHPPILSPRLLSRSQSLYSHAPERRHRRSESSS